MVTFIHRFVLFDHKREYSARLTKHKYNRGTIEAFNKKKERFPVLISLLPIHTFRGIRIVPRRRDCCWQVNNSVSSTLGKWNFIDHLILTCNCSTNTITRSMCSTSMYICITMMRMCIYYYAKYQYSVVDSVWDFLAQKVPLYIVISEITEIYIETKKYFFFKSSELHSLFLPITSYTKIQMYHTNLSMKYILHIRPWSIQNEPKCNYFRDIFRI